MMHPGDALHDGTEPLLIPVPDTAMGYAPATGGAAPDRVPGASGGLSFASRSSYISHAEILTAIMDSITNYAALVPNPLPDFLAMILPGQALANAPGRLDRVTLALRGMLRLTCLTTAHAIVYLFAMTWTAVRVGELRLGFLLLVMRAAGCAIQAIMGVIEYQAGRGQLRLETLRIEDMRLGEPVNEDHPCHEILRQLCNKLQEFMTLTAPGACLRQASPRRPVRHNTSADAEGDEWNDSGTRLALLGSFSSGFLAFFVCTDNEHVWKGLAAGGGTELEPGTGVRIEVVITVASLVASECTFVYSACLMATCILRTRRLCDKLTRAGRGGLATSVRSVLNASRPSMYAQLGWGPTQTALGTRVAGVGEAAGDQLEEGGLAGDHQRINPAP